MRFILRRGRRRRRRRRRVLTLTCLGEKIELFFLSPLGAFFFAPPLLPLHETNETSEIATSVLKKNLKRRDEKKYIRLVMGEVIVIAATAFFP